MILEELALRLLLDTICFVTAWDYFFRIFFDLLEFVSHLVEQSHDVIVVRLCL